MSRLPGPIYPLIAVLSWGAMFPIAAIALPDVDPFNITAIRYGLASVVFVTILIAVEGWGAVSLDSRGVRVFLLGSLGFAGFNLLAYLALLWSQPQDVAVIVPTMPLVTVVIRWIRGEGRPTAVVLGASLVALVGVLLVVTKGNLQALSGGVGDLLTLIAVCCWVTYTLGAAEFPTWSPVRYTALTAALGTVTIVIATVIADLAGWQHLPTIRGIADAWWELAFIVVFGAVAAVLSWNHGARLLGAANTALFIVLVPVVAFTIRIGQGYRPAPAELLGAGIVVTALIAANLLGRRVAAAPLTATEVDLCPGR